MFLAAPTGTSQPLRVAPVATALLLAMNVVVAAWTLPLAEGVESARQSSVLVLSRGGSRPGTQRVETVRAEAVRARLAALDAADPFLAWAYRAGAAPWRTLSALFVHADLVHLAVNLLVLVLVGSQLEQVWGPVAVFALYLTAGAGALYLDAHSGSTALVLGASGGVAALFGAFSLRFRRAPLRCRYVHLVFLRPQCGRFEVPCWTLAALWLAQQVVGCVVMRQTGDTSIAFVSHLAGFGLGVAAAAGASACRNLPRAVQAVLQKQPSCRSPS